MDTCIYRCELIHIQCSAAKDKAKFLSDARKTKIKSVVEKYVALQKAQNAKTKKHRSSSSKKEKKQEKPGDQDHKEDQAVHVEEKEVKEADAAEADAAPAWCHEKLQCVVYIGQRDEAASAFWQFRINVINKRSRSEVGAASA